MSDKFDNDKEQEEVVEAPRKRAPKIITVYGANKKEVDRVAFFEVNDFHPEGEAYVVNDGVGVEVAETPAVKRAIAEGRLTTERVNWNSKINTPKRGTVLPKRLQETVPTAAPETGNVAPNATTQDFDSPLRKGVKPGGK